MDELLRKAPMVYSTASRSRSELHRQWQEWRSECIRWRDSADFIGIPWLQKIVRVSCKCYIPKQNSILDGRRGGCEMGRLENNNNIGFYAFSLFRYSAVMMYSMTLSKYLLIND